MRRKYTKEMLLHEGFNLFQDSPIKCLKSFVTKKKNKFYAISMIAKWSKVERSGLVDNSKGKFEINTINEYLFDSEIRGLTKKNFVFNDEEIKRIKEIKINNTNGQEISAIYLTNSNSNKWIIGLHGWSENKYLALRQTYLFYQQGYNVITFDFKGHGASYGEINDIGFSSGDDINAIVKWIKEEHQMTQFGLIGNSMGATSAIRYVQNYQDYKNDLIFVIEDCGFADLKTELRYLMETEYEKPWENISSHLTRMIKLQMHWDVKKYTTLKDMDKISDVPILFLHGDLDRVVPIFMAKEMFKKKTKYEKNKISDLVIFPNGGHATIISNNNKLYKETILKFLKKVKG